MREWKLREKNAYCLLFLCQFHGHGNGTNLEWLFHLSIEFGIHSTTFVCIATALSIRDWQLLTLSMQLYRMLFQRYQSLVYKSPGVFVSLHLFFFPHSQAINFVLNSQQSNQLDNYLLFSCLIQWLALIRNKNQFICTMFSKCKISVCSWRKGPVDDFVPNSHFKLGMLLASAMLVHIILLLFKQLKWSHVQHSWLGEKMELS